MEFKIIPNEQTPCVWGLITPEELTVNKDIYVAYLKFAAEHQNAVGLAANQCSLDDERFMQNLFALRDLKTDTWKLAINPKVIKSIGMVEQQLEGCLTWIGKLIIAQRSRAVEVSYQDIEGNNHIEIHKGFEAQIWQHEINHLLGVEEQVVERDYKLPSVKSPQRTDKCPCGSGKKYKQCCLLYLD
jgi:peptide deformylase